MIIASTGMSAVAQYYLKVGVTSLQKDIQKNVWELFKSIFLNLHILFGFFLYLIGAVLWLYVLSKFELSKAYPFASLGYVFSLLLGYFLLNENLSASRILGLCLIVLGVYFISRS